MHRVCAHGTNIGMGHVGIDSSVDRSTFATPRYRSPGMHEASPRRLHGVNVDSAFRTRHGLAATGNVQRCGIVLAAVCNLWQPAYGERGERRRNGKLPLARTTEKVGRLHSRPLRLSLSVR